MWWKPENFARKRLHLETRVKLIRSIREFFDHKGFIEVETPILQVSPVMDAHIHAMKVDLRDIGLAYDKTLYLHTSPEFAMKKLMVAGIKDLYQICHVFRDGENSALHSREFTMIEWYRSGSDYNVIMDDCLTLLQSCAKALGISYYCYKDLKCNPFITGKKMSVCEAFLHYASLNLEQYLDDPISFSKAINNLGIRVADDDHWDDLFFRVMAEKIEPYLGVGEPLILYDYPCCMASLSRPKDSDNRFAERFELYVCGIELANAFSELTDAKVQRQRFEQDMTLKRQLYHESYPIDEDFLLALDYGLPECSGIALGIDRLSMLASGTDNIDDVLWTEKP